MSLAAIDLLVAVVATLTAHLRGLHALRVDAGGAGCLFPSRLGTDLAAQGVELIVAFQSWQIVVRYGMPHLQAGRPLDLARLVREAEDDLGDPGLLDVVYLKEEKGNVGNRDDGLGRVNGGEKGPQ